MRSYYLNANYRLHLCYHDVSGVVPSGHYQEIVYIIYARTILPNNKDEDIEKHNGWKFVIITTMMATIVRVGMI